MQTVKCPRSRLPLYSTPSVHLAGRPCTHTNTTWPRELIVALKRSFAREESYDRRDLLKFGCILCTLSHLGMGFYYHAAGSAPHWLALASLLVFIFGFGIAVAPIPFLMIAELFPTEAVGVASSIAIGLNWVCSFIVTLTFESLKDRAARPITLPWQRCSHNHLFLKCRTRDFVAERICGTIANRDQLEGLAYICLQYR